jgi:hypothetical protein
MRERRLALQRKPWLRPTLLVIDLVLLILGLFIHPVIGFVLGLLMIAVNELLTPVVVRRVFIKELEGQIRPTGHLEILVIPANKKRDFGAGDEEQQVPEEPPDL